MHKPLATIGAISTGIVVLLVIWLGKVNLPEYWTQLAVALTVLAIGMLGWGWKDEIEEWINSQHAQPILEVSLKAVNPEEAVERVEVWLPNGELRTHDARFCFMTVTNSGKDAKGLFLSCQHHMLLMPYKAKQNYRVDNPWDKPEEFDDEVKNLGTQAYVIAVLDGVEQTEQTTLLRGESKDFVLFFTLKGFGPTLCVPGFTRNYFQPFGSPPKVMLNVYFRHKHATGYYWAKFEIVVHSWDNFKPSLVSCEFHPFKRSR